MSKLSGIGLQSVIQDVRVSDENVINIRTDSKLKLRGNQIRNLTGKLVFEDVEELILPDARVSEMWELDALT